MSPLLTGLFVGVTASLGLLVAETPQLEVIGCDSPRPSVEARAIFASNGKASRDGCALTIQAGRNRVRLVDDLREQGSTYIRYQYNGALSNTEFHVVVIFFYEGTAYELVGPNGNARLVGFPLLSPDGHRVLSSSKDLYAAFNPNAVEIWNIERGLPRLEISIRSDEWGPSDARWVDAQTIEFGQTSINDNGMEQTRTGARLQRISSNWSLVSAAR